MRHALVMDNFFRARRIIDESSDEEKIYLNDFDSVQEFIDKGGQCKIILENKNYSENLRYIIFFREEIKSEKVLSPKLTVGLLHPHDAFKDSYCYYNFFGGKISKTFKKITIFTLSLKNITYRSM